MAKLQTAVLHEDTRHLMPKKAPYFGLFGWCQGRLGRFCFNSGLLPRAARRFWKNEKFSGYDLKRYLDEDLTPKIIWAGLKIQEEDIILGNVSVKRAGYLFDSERHMRKHKNIKQ